jgi:hypothetical protein
MKVIFEIIFLKLSNSDEKQKCEFCGHKLKKLISKPNTKIFNFVRI